jgi:hypothetical protein
VKPSRRIIAVSISILWLAAAAAAETGANQSVVQQEPCCFENPRFSGTCEVTPGQDESCGDILGYLNNPNSVGKNYCGNTKVRGGWTTVSCEGASTSSASNTCRTDRPMD